ncbi:MAG: UbiD family decarboxylase [Candidatus Bathyarchaeota archaeon]|nr:UbiD family decarboxylase [Candidatus Bathyarchaeota archaeon]
MESLRSYLERLEGAIPDQLMRVSGLVDWRYEVTALVSGMEKVEGNPALFFENVKDYATPLLVNLFGHIDRINLAIGYDSHRRGGRLDFYEKWNRSIGERAPPIYASGGPVKEVRRRGGDVDLTCLPIPKFYEQDGGRYLTAGLLVARNPDLPDEVNLTYARMVLKGRCDLGVSLHSRGHTWQYFERSKAAGEPLDIAVIIGAHPALYLAAAAKITNEYNTAGALIGEPIELVGCETVDLPVPSQAEIVLEGQILLDEGDEGPFTEYTGYISGRSTRNHIHITAMTTREDPIFLAVAPSNASEHLLLSGLPKQARISRTLVDSMHVNALKDIVWPVSGTHFVCFASLKESMSATPGLAKQHCLLLLGLDHYVKIVAVFPAETDIADVSGALGAMALRCDFERGSGIEVLGGVFSQYLDPSSSRAGLSSKMILDATGPEIETLSKVAMPDVKEVLSSNRIREVSFPCDGNPCFCAIKATMDVSDPTVLLDEPSLNRCRLIVCVDEDIDTEDGRQILWAVATRFQPAEGAFIRDGRLLLDARKPENWKAMRATIPPSAYLVTRKL